MGGDRKSRDGEEEEKKKKRRGSFSDSEDERRSKRHRSVDDEEPNSSSRRKKKKDKSDKKKKSHKSSKHDSDEDKNSKEKHKSKRDKHDDRQRVKVQEELTVDDYFQKNNEFATWLKEEKRIFFSDLSSESARDMFSQFVKKWNTGKLESRYYQGISTGPRSAHRWKIKK